MTTILVILASYTLITVVIATTAMTQWQVAVTSAKYLDATGQQAEHRRAAEALKAARYAWTWPYVYARLLVAAVKAGR